MSSSAHSLRSLIEDTFSSSDADDFLLTYTLADVYTFVSDEIVASHAGAPGDEMTVLLDTKTAENTEVLRDLRQAHQICICGDNRSGSLSIPDHAVYIKESPVGVDDAFILVLTPMTSYLAFNSTSPRDEAEDSEPQGFWSFHRDSIIRVANALTNSVPITIAEYRPSESDYPVSTNIMNTLAHLGTYMEDQQQHAELLNDDFSHILDIVKSLSVRRSTHEILYLFVEQISAMVQTDRCSVVRIWEDENEGHVLASHEDASVNNMVIDLSKYPEVINTLKTSEMTLINDVKNDPIVSEVSDQLTELGITSILVVPIVLFNEKVGTFLLRTFRKDSTFSKREVDFCNIVSETAANAMERADLFETIQKTNRSLERLATTDALTGLYNRRYFIGQFEDEISRATRYEIPTACILIDIDDFKSVNDTYGHLAGDEVLREVSRRTLDSVRGTDVVARYGGEELIILLPQTNFDGASKHANRLLTTISEKPYRGLPEDRVITVSVGIALHESHDPITADEFVRKSDVALYEAKRAGKNQFVLYTEEMVKQ